MTDEERIIHALIQRDFRISLHARERMTERSVTVADIATCAKTGTIKYDRDGKFDVVGKDLEGDDLKVVCAFDGDVLIVTIF